MVHICFNLIVLLVNFFSVVCIKNYTHVRALIHAYLLTIDNRSTYLFLSVFVGFTNVNVAIIFHLSIWYLNPFCAFNHNPKTGKYLMICGNDVWSSSARPFCRTVKLTIISFYVYVYQPEGWRIMPRNQFNNSCTLRYSFPN